MGHVDASSLKRPTTAPALYAQDSKGMNAVVHEHYFVGGFDWLITEYDPTDDLAFGWACLNDRDNAELGYVSMAELAALRMPLRIRFGPDEGGAMHQGSVGVERDEHWPDGLTLTEAINRIDRAAGR